MHRAQGADIAALSAACLVRAQDFGMSAIAGQYLSIYRAASPGVHQ
jgi:protein tyrosine/serine phosphatase